MTWEPTLSSDEIDQLIDMQLDQKRPCVELDPTKVPAVSGPGTTVNSVGHFSVNVDDDDETYFTEGAWLGGYFG